MAPAIDDSFDAPPNNPPARINPDHKLYMPEYGFNAGMFYVRVMAMHLVHDGIGDWRMFIREGYTKGRF